MDDINIQYNSTLNIFNQNITKILSDIEKSKFNKSLTCILHKSYQIDSLLNAIEKCENNYYASQVLLRSVFEHFLVGYYVYLKTRINQNDLAGEEYYMNYAISESFKRKSYNLMVENIRLRVNENISFEILKSQFSGLEEMEESELHEQNRLANQFDIKKIAKYVINYSSEIEAEANFHSILLDLLVQYSFLSSFIHGGPSADIATFNPINSVELFEITKKNIEWTKVTSKTLKRNILMLLFIEFPKEYVNLTDYLFNYSK